MTDDQVIRLYRWLEPMARTGVRIKSFSDAIVAETGKSERTLLNAYKAICDSVRAEPAILEVVARHLYTPPKFDPPTKWPGAAYRSDLQRHNRGKRRG